MTEEKNNGKFMLRLMTNSNLEVINPPVGRTIPSHSMYVHVGYYDKNGISQTLTDRIHTIIVSEGEPVGVPTPNAPSDSLILGLSPEGLGRCPACFNYSVMQIKVNKVGVEGWVNRLLGDKCFWCGWKRDA